MITRVAIALLLFLFGAGSAFGEAAPMAKDEPSAAEPPVSGVVVTGEAKASVTMSPEDLAREEALRAAIKDAPDSSKSYANLGAFLMGHNKNREAVENYQQAIMRDPENPALFVAIAIAYLHDGHHERASMMAEQALRLDPSSANAQKLLEYISAKDEPATDTESH